MRTTIFPIRRFSLPVIAFMFAAVSPVFSQDHAKDTTRLQQLAWWKSQRFGMFIHWGPVALTGKEIGWSRGKGTPPLLPYDTLYKAFNPTGFNADAWVQIARSAGMRYLVFTAKHMDGFCEFNSALTNYKITAADCPFGRDVSKELADACHKANMGLGFYYIPEDWYSQRIMSSADYVTYYSNQVVNELLSNYGRVDLIWFDNGPVYGGKVGPAGTGETLLGKMRAKQPWVLVDNRGDTGPLGDFSTPEQTLGSFDTLHAWESCMTIDGANQWAWNPDGGVKTLRQLMGMVVGCANGGGNCLLNVGPRPDGIIDPPMVTRLRQIGVWMNKYGESIYGTQGGPIIRGAWGGSTHKKDTMYLHLAPFGGSVTIPPVNARIISAVSLSGGTPTIAQTDESIAISLPQPNIDSLYTVLKLALDYSRRIFRYKNVAQGKTATQSSTAYGGTPNRAVDGNTDGYFYTGSISHTDSAANPWWMVDLGGTYPINNIAVYNRTDCCGERLSNFTVSILDQTQAQVWTGGRTVAPDPMIKIPAGPTNGRYVKFQLNGTGYLCLAEVMVNVDTAYKTGVDPKTVTPAPLTMNTPGWLCFPLSGDHGVQVEFFSCNGKNLGAASDALRETGVFIVKRSLPGATAFRRIVKVRR